MPTEPRVLAVRAWPQSQSLALQDLRLAQGITVIGVTTPVTTDRTLARTLARNALRETLGVLLDLPAASVVLVARPGKGIAMDSSLAHLGLSLSHAPGLSIAALCRGASVGIDLMRTEDGVAADPEWLRVARDYLGPEVTARLQATSPVECPAAFAVAWTRFEACLKCLGLALTEWSPALGRQLATCQVWTLATHGPFLGAVAKVNRAIGSCSANAPSKTPSGPPESGGCAG